MSSAYQVAPLTDREQLAHWYTLDGDGAAAAFLDAHPGLTPLLLEAYPIVKKYFPQSGIALRVTCDPAALEWCELLVAIDPGCPPTEALDRYEQFKQSWWLAARRRAGKSLMIIVQYL